MQDAHMFHGDDGSVRPIRSLSDAEIAELLEDGIEPRGDTDVSELHTVMARLEIEQIIRRLSL